MKTTRFTLVTLLILCMCGELYAQMFQMRLKRRDGKPETHFNGIPVEDDTFRIFLTKMARSVPDITVSIRMETNVLASDLVHALGVLQQCGISNSHIYTAWFNGTNAGLWHLALKTAEIGLPDIYCGDPMRPAGFHPVLNTEGSGADNSDPETNRNVRAEQPACTSDKKP